ncbi:hypothetical protein HK101_008813 [Irineochytrium annulatum]|nr:hypothetical protein HK101_008813 [Irineochytrium annulatum]
MNLKEHDQASHARFANQSSQIVDSLKKENFDLKLRIFFLEERLDSYSADEDDDEERSPTEDGPFGVAEELKCRVRDLEAEVERARTETAKAATADWERLVEAMRDEHARELEQSKRARDEMAGRCAMLEDEVEDVRAGLQELIAAHEREMEKVRAAHEAEMEGVRREVEGREEELRKAREEAVKRADRAEAEARSSREELNRQPSYGELEKKYDDAIRRAERAEAEAKRADAEARSLKEEHNRQPSYGDLARKCDAAVRRAERAEDDARSSREELNQRHLAGDVDRKVDEAVRRAERAEAEARSLREELNRRPPYDELERNRDEATWRAERAEAEAKSLREELSRRPFNGDLEWKRDDAIRRAERAEADAKASREELSRRPPYGELQRTCEEAVRRAERAEAELDRRPAHNDLERKCDEAMRRAERAEAELKSVGAKLDEAVRRAERAEADVKLSREELNRREGPEVEAIARVAKLREEHAKALAAHEEEVNAVRAEYGRVIGDLIKKCEEAVCRAERAESEATSMREGPMDGHDRTSQDDKAHAVALQTADGRLRQSFVSRQDGAFLPSGLSESERDAAKARVEELRLEYSGDLQGALEEAVAAHASEVNGLRTEYAAVVRDLERRCDDAVRRATMAEAHGGVPKMRMEELKHEVDFNSRPRSASPSYHPHMRGQSQPINSDVSRPMTPDFALSSERAIECFKNCKTVKEKLQDRILSLESKMSELRDRYHYDTGRAASRSRSPNRYFADESESHTAMMDSHRTADSSPRAFVLDMAESGTAFEEAVARLQASSILQLEELGTRSEKKMESLRDELDNTRTELFGERQSKLHLAMQKKMDSDYIQSLIDQIAAYKQQIADFNRLSSLASQEIDHLKSELDAQTRRVRAIEEDWRRDIEGAQGGVHFRDAAGVSGLASDSDAYWTGVLSDQRAVWKKENALLEQSLVLCKDELAKLETALVESETEVSRLREQLQYTSERPMELLKIYQGEMQKTTKELEKIRRERDELMERDEGRHTGDREAVDAALASMREQMRMQAEVLDAERKSKEQALQARDDLVRQQISFLSEVYSQMVDVLGTEERHGGDLEDLCHDITSSCHKLRELKGGFVQKLADLEATHSARHRELEAKLESCLERFVKARASIETAAANQVTMRDHIAMLRRRAEIGEAHQRELQAKLEGTARAERGAALEARRLSAAMRELEARGAAGSRLSEGAARDWEMREAFLEEELRRVKKQRETASQRLEEMELKNKNLRKQLDISERHCEMLRNQKLKAVDSSLQQEDQLGLLKINEKLRSDFDENRALLDERNASVIDLRRQLAEATQRLHAAQSKQRKKEEKLQATIIYAANIMEQFNGKVEGMDRAVELLRTAVKR